jgi:hypothetical protein
MTRPLWRRRSFYFLCLAVGDFVRALDQFVARPAPSFQISDCVECSYDELQYQGCKKRSSDQSSAENVYAEHWKQNFGDSSRAHRMSPEDRSVILSMNLMEHVLNSSVCHVCDLAEAVLPAMRPMTR